MYFLNLLVRWPIKKENKLKVTITNSIVVCRQHRCRVIYSRHDTGSVLPEIQNKSICPTSSFMSLPPYVTAVYHQFTSVLCRHHHHHIINSIIINIITMTNIIITIIIITAINFIKIAIVRFSISRTLKSRLLFVSDLVKQ